MSSAASPPVSGRGDRRILVVLGALGMIGPFSIDTIFPAFAQMGGQLGVSQLALQQLVSLYLVAFAGMSLFHGPLSDAIGRRKVIVGGMLLYAAASVVCALAPSMGWLLAGRIVQGLSAGAGTIIGRAVVRDVFEGARAQQVMSQIAMIFGLAPAFAPLVGGWLLLAGPWRTVFWFLFAFSLLLVLAVLLALPETHPADRRTPLRPRPLVTSLWAVWADPRGRRLALTGMLSFAGAFAYISGAPIIVVDRLHRGEQDFWMLFMPLIGGMIAGSWVSGRLASRVPARRLASTGYAVSAVGGLLLLGASLLPADGFPWPLVPLPLYTFGVSLAFPILSLALLDLFPDARGAAASVQSFVQLLVNAVIAGVIAPLLGRSMTTLALGALAATLLGLVLWRRHLADTGAEPHATPDTPAYEPTEDM